MDRLSSLAAFVAVAEEDGFAAAGRRLGLATSSVTRQVDALEAHLGLPLVNRSTHGITLTDAGERYLANARDVLDRLDAADRDVREADGEASGVLRVSVPVAFARLHVAPMLPAFLRDNPKLTVDLLPSDRRVDLVEERIDVAIRMGTMEDSSLVARRLSDHARIVCASPDYLERHGAPAHPDDLREHTCLAFDFGTGLSIWRFVQDGEMVEVAVDGPLRSAGSDLLLEAALQGAGLIMSALWLADTPLRDGRLVPVLTDWEVRSGVEPGAIFALMLPNRRGLLKVRRFVDALARHIGTPPVWEGCVKSRHAG